MWAEIRGDLLLHLGGQWDVVFQLTCVSEAMDETTSRFAIIHRVAGSAQDEEAAASPGLVAGSDQGVFLAEFTP